MTSVDEATLPANDPATPRAAAPLSAGLLRDYGIVAAVVGLYVVLAFTAPNFFTVENLKNVLDQNAYLAIAAFGATLVIIAGGFDLSAGALFAFTGVVAAYVAVHVDPLLGLAAGLAAGVVAGVVNGALITGLRVHSFLITLAVGIVLGGVSYRISQGQLIDASSSPTFVWLGRGDLVGGIPNSILVTVLVGVLLTLLLRSTSFGRYVYAVGGNPVASRLSGVRVAWVVIGAFAISGLAASIGGLIEVSRAGTGQSDPGNAANLALDAIAAVVVGGTSIEGGRGAIWRTALGVALLALVNNGFNLLGVAPEWQSIVSGGIIIVAVALNALSGRR